MLLELGGSMGAFLEDVLASLPPDGHKAWQWKVRERADRHGDGDTLIGSQQIGTGMGTPS
jgi:hypothetical protein